MTRPLRIEYPGAWHYVQSHAVPEREVFSSSEYRTLYLALLEEMVLQFGIEVHAYTLLNQCSHILLRSPQANMAKSLSWINSVFTQRVNHKAKKRGPVFKGRYRSVLFDECFYLADLSRYIHLLQSSGDNLLSPKTCRSSASYYLDEIASPQWLTTQSVRDSIARVESLSIRQFNLQGNRPEIPRFYERLRVSPIMGDALFKKDVEKLSLDYYTATQEDASLATLNSNLSHREIVGQIALLLQVSQSYLKKKPAPRKTFAENETLKENRRMAVFLCRAMGGLSIKEIASEFSIGHQSTVSRLISEVKVRIKNDPEFANKISNFLTYKPLEKRADNNE